MLYPTASVIFSFINLYQYSWINLSNYFIYMSRSPPMTIARIVHICRSKDKWCKYGHDYKLQMRIRVWNIYGCYADADGDIRPITSSHAPNIGASVSLTEFWVIFFLYRKSIFSLWLIGSFYLYKTLEQWMGADRVANNN